MKRMSRYTRTGKLLVLLLCALLLVSTLPAFGARNTGNAKKKNKGTGSVTVSLSTAHTKLPSNAKVEFTLYKIGDPAPDDPAGWKFDSGLAKYEKNIISAGKLSDDKTQEAVNELAKKIPGSYKVETKALSNGSATFDDLADGVYLGVLSKAPTGMTANASLFTIPVKNDTTGQLSYSLDITVKDEYTAPTPTPRSRPRPPRPTTILLREEASRTSRPSRPPKSAARRSGPTTATPRIRARAPSRSPFWRTAHR